MEPPFSAFLPSPTLSRFATLRPRRYSALVGMDTFGASAPSKHLQTKFGLTTEAVVVAAKARRAAARG